MIHARRIRLILPLAAIIAAGCEEKPKAPPLKYEALFQSDNARIRFLAPRNWEIVTRSDVPPGELAKPVLLVSYLQSVGLARPAEFELYIADLPADTSFRTWYSGRKFGPAPWKLKDGEEAVEVGGVRGERFTSSVASGKDEQLRETTAFRRGNRVYFFILTCAARDEDLRDHVRSCIASATWTD